ncbi:MAG: hypothetical protein WCK16_05555, partial [Candidatus Moraniibacteriota bacterium]
DNAETEANAAARYNALAGRNSGALAMSAINFTNSQFWNAVIYCRDLSATAAVAMDGNTSTTYTDWRIPTFDELMAFGNITESANLWTSTPGTTVGSIIYTNMLGQWGEQAAGGGTFVRCVR